jgi:radical SAM protein with 4Fe4S-binding SPASM domain
VTYRCNLRCYFCYQKRPAGVRRKELSLAVWSAVFSQLAHAGTLYMTLTGGEPFMRRDILPMVALARENGFAVSMITNGTLIMRPIVRALADLGIMDIGISLHAADRALHDRLTGKPGSFRSALNSIRRCAEAGIKVIIKHTVSKANFGQYRLLESLADREGCLFECDSFVVPPEKKTVSSFALSGDQHGRFIRDMNAATVFAGNADSLHCDAGRSVAGITPYGDLVPCILLPVRFGSLRNRPFAGLWNGARAAAFRAQERQLIAQCESCGIRTYCSRCHGLAYAESGDFRAASPSCCVRAKAAKERLSASGAS